MRPILVACLVIVGAQLSAQAPTAADTAAILKAAVPKDGRMQFMDIVGDTAIVVGMIQRQTSNTKREGTVTTTIDSVSFDPWEARVERRKGQWVRVSRRLEPSSGRKPAP